MTLSNLISDLKHATESGKVDYDSMTQLVEGRIILPEDFKLEEVPLSYLNQVYCLVISASPTRSFDDAQPILDSLFTRAKNLRLKKGVADVEYTVFWTPEDFQKETELTGFVNGKVRIRGHVHTVDPTKVRIGPQGINHELEASLKGNKLILTAEGHYRKELEKLIETLNPQIAKLRLSKEDAERLLRKVENSPSVKHIAPFLEKALQPEERATISLGLGSMSFGSKEIIEIDWPTEKLDFVRDAIGKPLLNCSGKDETGVTELIKSYPFYDLSRRRVLSDLQYLTREIPKIDLGIVYGNPVITLKDAKELLDAEVKMISQCYEPRRGGSLWQESALHRIARDQFDEETVYKLGKLDVTDYVAFLKTKGYQLVDQSLTEELQRIEGGEDKNEADSRPEVREYYARKRHKLKGKHLLSFFKQCYEQNPDGAIQNFRRWYMNNKPELEISATAKQLDASKLKGLKLPPKSRLMSFEITERIRTAFSYSNTLLISRLCPSDDEVYFRSRTSVTSPPIILPLQELVCKEMGICFR